MAHCESCRQPLESFQVTCVQCGEERWAYLAEKPSQYVCQRCRSGAGEARRASGRVAAEAKARLRQSQALVKPQGERRSP